MNLKFSEIPKYDILIDKLHAILWDINGYTSKCYLRTDSLYDLERIPYEWEQYTDTTLTPLNI